MLAGSARISRSAPAGAPLWNGASFSGSRPLERSSLHRLSVRSPMRVREVGTPQASFLETLFAGGSQAPGGVKERAGELVEELLQKLGSNRNKPLIGPNEEIDGLVRELQGVNMVRNPARSPMLVGSYDVRYLERLVIPPMATNPQYFITETEHYQQFTTSAFGLFPVKATRVGAKTNGPNYWTTRFESATLDKGLLGKEVVESKAVTKYDVLFFDERVLVLRTTIIENPAEPSKIQNQSIQVLVKQGESFPKVETEKLQEESDISPGRGLGKVARKSGAATKAERSYREQEQTANKKKVAAEREAQQEALRLEKEKAAAEREKALALKAEIKESVDGFNQRLKDAQNSKKEAAAALKTFERDNADVLKEVVIFRKEMATFDNEIASLLEEAQNLTEQEKVYAEEIRNCRRELAELGKKLALY